MRDIRRALLEADVSLFFKLILSQFMINEKVSYFVQVSLPVVRRFVQAVTEQSVGVGLIRGVRPDQQLVKVDFIVFSFYEIYSIAIDPDLHRDLHI